MADQWMHRQELPLEQSKIRKQSHGSADGKASLSAIRDSSTASPPQDSNGGAPASKGAAPTRIRRRNRLIQSCLECRRRKLKCDKQEPCSNCSRFRRDCMYLGGNLNQQTLADIKEKMGALEKNLEREVASRGTKTKLSRATGDDQDGEDDEDDDFIEDEDILEPTPLAAEAVVYEDTGDDELLDLGLQIGHLRVTERLGGWLRPKLVEELSDTLSDVQKTSHEQELQHKDHVKLRASPKSYIGPGPDFIAPTSSFIFGSNMNTGLMDYLPAQTASDQLIQQYKVACHLLCKTVHWPTFELQYSNFWETIASGTLPSASIQALMLGVMFTAAVSMTDDQVAHQFRTSRQALIDTLRSGTEFALSKANFLRTTKLQVMQAFVIYLIPMVRSEVVRSHSALVGMAIRLAECMGLHRDGSNYAMPPVEIHTRRMIWHQLCFLDQRCAEAVGPMPQIRREDYDTKLPLNIDDADLMRPTPPTEDANQFTNMTAGRIRAECTEARRANWFDMRLVDAKKKKLSSVLIRIQRFRQGIESRYLPMLDEKNPFHLECKHIIALNVNALFIQTLHRYLFSTSTQMPDKLRALCLECGVTQMENAIALETNVDLAPWKFYSGAFNQYHSALFLLREIFKFPARRDADRIWKCLNYIFQIPAFLSPSQKTSMILTDLRDRLGTMQALRRVRADVQMEERVLGLSKSSLRETSNDATFQTSPQSNIDFGVPIAPNAYSPPPAVPTEFSDSRQGSAAAPDTETPMMVDEIDWNEMNKWFSPDMLAADLNNPDYDLSQFNAGYSMDGNLLAGGMLPTQPRDMSDVNMSSTTMYPTPNYMPYQQAQNPGR